MSGRERLRPNRSPSARHQLVRARPTARRRSLYFHKLLRAGVEARGRMALGLCHASDFMLPDDLPEIFSSTIHDVQHFAAGRSHAARR